MRTATAACRPRTGRPPEEADSACERGVACGQVLFEQLTTLRRFSIALRRGRAAHAATPDGFGPSERGTAADAAWAKAGVRAWELQGSVCIAAAGLPR